MSVLVTGASGVLGSSVARALAAAHRPAVLGTHRPHAVAEAHADRAEVRRLDYDDPTTFDTSLAGITELLLVAPLGEAHSDRRLAPFVKAAANAGVEHFIVNSACMSALSETFALRRLERAVEETGRSWAHLRSHWYMSTLTRGMFAPMPRGGELALPIGTADRIAYVAVEDVADVVLAVLADPGRHAGNAYELSGPEALDGPTVTAWCSGSWNIPVTFRSLDEDTYARACREAGLPEDTVGLLLELFSVVRDGHGAHTTTAVREVTGHAPRTLRHVLADGR
ncbi:NAD(P)H-binding protein [Streptomyces sp. NPDC088196]|uniref:NmrA family NAD(P)-binding protein n=1 Tax=Streptomyces sp. NPDC088196 TaxID=3154868 RepID=UPI00344D4775